MVGFYLAIPFWQVTLSVSTGVLAVSTDLANDNAVRLSRQIPQNNSILLPHKIYFHLPPPLFLGGNFAAFCPQVLDL